MESSSYQSNANAVFNRKAQSIASSIQKISQNVSSMQRLLASSSSPSAVGSRDEESIRNQIQSLTHYTGQLAQDTKNDLKNLVTEGQTKSERLMRDKLMSDFTSVLNSFQQVQRNASQIEKQKMETLKHSGANQQRFHDDDILPPPPSSSLKNTSNNYHQMQEFAEQIDNQELLEREAAIRQLESDILDVNQIFKDLATMVHEQGEMVDSIEANIESTSIRVSDGVEQLRSASSYQTSARKKKCILFTVLAIVLVIVIIIVVYT